MSISTNVMIPAHNYYDNTTCVLKYHSSVTQAHILLYIDIYVCIYEKFSDRLFFIYIDVNPLINRAVIHLCKSNVC